MSNIYKYRELPRNYVNNVVPTMIECGMTGVVRATQSKDGFVTLFYQDGQRESAMVPELEIIECDNFFAIVDAVQSKRLGDEV